jgi:cell division protein FtsA
MVRTAFKPGSQKIITAIDIGSFKVACIIAAISKDDKIPPVILGIGAHGIQSVKKGEAPTLEEVEHAIAHAVHKAEKTANMTVKEAIINISGPHLISEIVKVSTNIQGRGVKEADIHQLLLQGMKTSHNKPFTILHANPIRFSIDNGAAIRDPRGMFGNILTGYLHMVTSALNPARTLINCLKRCHISARGIVPSAIASGYGTLVDDEMGLGVVLIDLGSHYTNIAIFKDGDVIHTESIPIGSRNITKDLAHGLSTSLMAAERIKILHGSAIETTEDTKTIIEVPALAGGTKEGVEHIRRSRVISIIKPRVEEILELVKNRLEKSKVYKMTGRRLVITGGGSLLPGIKELAQTILQKQVRLGKPLNTFQSDYPYALPSFSTATGLLTYAIKRNYPEPKQESGQKTWVHAIIRWFKNNF